jgi:hypothetical protein
MVYDVLYADFGGSNMFKPSILVGGLEHEFDDFPFIGKNQRKLTNIFQRGSNQQPVKILV